MEHQVLQAALLDLLEVDAARRAPRAEVHLAVQLAQRLAAHGDLRLDRAVHLEDEGRVQPEEVDAQLAPLRVAQDGRLDQAVEQQLLERHDRLVRVVEHGQRRAERVQPAHVRRGRRVLQRAHEQVGDGLRHELVAARPLAEPPLLAQLDDRRLQRARARVLQVEDDVVQLLRHLEHLGRSLMVGVRDGVPGEDSRAVKHAQRRRDVSLALLVVRRLLHRRLSGVERHLHMAPDALPHLLLLGARERVDDLACLRLLNEGDQRVRAGVETCE